MQHYSSLDIFEIWLMGSSIQGKGVQVRPQPGRATPTTWMDTFFQKSEFYSEDFVLHMGTNHGLQRPQWMQHFSSLDIFEIWWMGSSIQGRESKYGFNLVQQLPPPGWTHFFKSLNFIQRTLSCTGHQPRPSQASMDATLFKCVARF